MKNPIQKIKLIYWTFLCLAVGFVSVYTFLHWLLIIKLELFEMNEMVIDFWLPFGLPWIPILIFLRKRIKLLKLTGGNGNLPFLYQFIAAIALAVPTIVAQGYVRSATGKLTHVGKISEVNLSQRTKYYQIDKIYLDKRFAGTKWSADVSGRYNEDLNLHVYFAVPVISGPDDTLKRFFSTWYGIEYREQISNRLDQSEKEREFSRFETSSIDKFNHEDLYKLEYFNRIGSTDEHEGIEEAVKSTKNFDHSAKLLILKPVNEPFESRNGNKFAWIFGSFGIAGFIWLLMILFPAFEETELKKFLSGKSSNKKDIKEAKEFFSILIPKKDFFITPVLIDLNVLIFIIMVFAGLGFISFKGQDLLAWGANFRPLVEEGEYWRLLSSVFLHGGLIHLVMNMLGLMFIGFFLEPILGTKRFAVFYLLTGIIASLASIWWHDATVSVGASGAIFGMYGIFLALLLTKLFPADFQKSFLLSTSIFVGYNLLIGLTGGIDNAAHIGGLLSGMLIGVYSVSRFKGKQARSLLTRNLYGVLKDYSERTKSTFSFYNEKAAHYSRIFCLTSHRRGICQTEILSGSEIAIDFTVSIR